MKVKHPDRRDRYPIPGFPGYQITKSGEVWSDKTNRFLTVGVYSDGYRVVSLTNDGHTTAQHIARLLLTTFVRLPNPWEQARHLNDIKLDDNFENLAWGTPLDNRRDMLKNGHQPDLGGERHWHSKLFTLDVINILTLCKKKCKQKDIAKMYGLSVYSISDFKLGKCWKHVYKIWNEVNEN